MRRRKSIGEPKEKARKQVAVQLVPEKHAGQITGPYRIMRELIEAHHPQLAEAKIAIAWRFRWRSDADGRIKLGQCKKGSDLDRELHGHDFVILLNHELWNTSRFTEAQMRALLDHELCHAEVTKDSNGEPKVDDRGRKCYRIRKHDVEEFREIVARHGEWKSDIEAFVQAAQSSKGSNRPLLDAAESNKGNKSKGKTPEPASA